MATRSLGVLSIDLVAKTGAFTQGMNKAERDAAAAGKRLEARMRSIGRAISAGLVASVAGVAGVATLVIRATAEAEKAQAQLAAVLKSTAGAAGLTQRELNEMAGELQKLTVFGDEAINSAQALLLTFTKIGRDVFPSAIEAALDMSTALGQDLNSSVQQLGKALNDPIKGVTALGRAGVQFSEDQKAMIERLVETGRVADAQKLILEELETQFGGSAEAARDTLGGALQSLQNAFGDLLEGDTGSEGVKGAKQALENLTATLQSPQVQEGFATAITFVSNLTAELATGISVITGYISEYAKLRGLATGGISLDDASYRDLNARLGQVQGRIMDLQKVGPVLTPQTWFRVAAGEDAGAEQARLAKPGLNMYDAEGELAFLLTERQRLVREIAEQNRQAAAVVAGGTPEIPVFDGGTTIIRPPKGWKTADRDAQREAAEAARDLAAAQELLNGVLREQSQEMGGPLLDAAFEYQDTMVKLLGVEEELIRLGKLDEEQAAKLALARLNAADSYRAKTEAIQGMLTPLQEMTAELDMELEVLGLSNAERETEARLRAVILEYQRQGVTLTDAEIDAARRRIQAKIEELEAERELISAMDGFRSSFEDNVAGVLDGTKSIKEAIRDLVSDFLAQMARMAAKNLTESLFGGFGTSSTGSSGGWLSGLFSWFGGGRASGGPIYPGKSYLVGEEGPELVRPMGAAMVVPAGETRKQMAGGGTTNITFVLPGRNDLRTEAQRQADLARTTQRQLARSTA